MNISKKTVAILIVMAIAATMIIFTTIKGEEHKEYIINNGVQTSVTPSAVDSFRSTSGRNSGSKTKYRAVFEYTVDGKIYQINHGSFTSRSKAEEFLARTDISVYYMANDPTDRVLKY